MRNSIKFILLLLVAVFILWFFGRNLDWQEVSQSLREANPFYLILATLIICLGYLLRAIRWQVLLAPITKTSIKELFAATTIGFSAILIVGRAGEIIRPMWLSMHDKRVRPSTALITLGVERIFDLASLVCFFAVNLIFFTAPAGRETEFGYVKLVGNLMLVGVIVGFIALYFYQKYSARFMKWFENYASRIFIPKKIQRIFLSLFNQLAISLGVLKDWREISLVVFWTIMLWFSIAIPTWLVLLAFGLPLSFIDSLFVLGLAALGSLVPTPGGAAGAFHAATANSLIFLNVSKDQAWATAFAMHIVYFAPAVIFGIYYFLHGDISVARFKSLLSPEHAVEEVQHEVESKVQNPKSKVEAQSSN